MAQINKPDTYFNIVLWTGDGTTKNITGVGFQPDLVWAKKRSATGFHAWCDSVRGGTKNIFSNATNAEETNATDWILSFASDGFGVNSAGNLNQSAATYASWNWLGSNTTASNTDGSITSTVSANTTSGFSIVSYTGNGVADATIGHGLNDTLAMIILKNRTDVENWWVYHKGLSDPSTKAILLNSANAEFTPGTSAFNPSGFSTSVFSTKNDNASNSNGDNYIAYCFAEKKGFSKFGSYTGNGINGDGTFVYTGFKPSFILIKNADEIKNWYIYDTTRDTLQPLDLYLSPNLNNAEASFSAFNTVDALSNGFKLRGGSTGNGSETNNTGKKYIYMCFAENPLVGTNNIPATAR
jgi:hypothetical protein